MKWIRGIKQTYNSWKARLTGKKYVINNIDVRPINRQSQDIQKWRNALISAEGPAQHRSLLYDLYSDMMLDGFLNRVIQKRISNITNKELTFTIDGKEVEDVTAIVSKTFFETFLTEAMNAKFWGHSLIEPHWPAKGQEDGKTILIPRKHVKPRYGIVTKSQYDTSGYSYIEGPLSKSIIEVGESETLGLLLQAAQYVIYKRGSFGDWAEYAEVFGMPFRWATYHNEESRGILEKAMAEAGSAGYVVAPHDAEIQFLNTEKSTGNDVFSRLRSACNEEISICILGNTMTTTEAKSSGYAQSQTHSESQQELHLSDQKYILRILNEKVTPYLARLGYPVNGGFWSFVDEDTMSLDKRIEIDLKVASMAPIDPDYWYDKYKIPKPKTQPKQQEVKKEEA